MRDTIEATAAALEDQGHALILWGSLVLAQAARWRDVADRLVRNDSDHTALAFLDTDMIVDLTRATMESER